MPWIWTVMATRMFCLLRKNDDKIVWYGNNGNQRFTENIISVNADGANSVYALDLDGDGDQDVLSASENDDKIAWYENDGNQEFTEHIISVNADGARSVYALDLDGDGDQDVLSASENDDKIAWYENDGNQEFTEHIISVNADGARSVYALDLDNDNNPDIIVGAGSLNSSKIIWYKNNGDKTFTEYIISTDANQTESVFALDLDGDRDYDVLSASFNDNKIAWYENLSISGDNNPPRVKQPLEDTLVFACNLPNTLNYDLSTVFEDPDQDIITLSIVENTNPELVSLQLMGDLLQVDIQRGSTDQVAIVVQALSRSCLSAFDTLNIFVEGVFTPEIQGTPTICQNERNIYFVDENPEYRYDWEVITASNERMIFQNTAQIEIDGVTQPSTVILSVNNLNNSCVSKDILEIQLINHKQVLLPNTFSPNQDGINDHFYLLLPQNTDQINSLEMKIYSRDGFLVYETKDVEEATNKKRGWDGANQVPGVYLYRVKLDYANCEDQILNGYINLIR